MKLKGIGGGALQPEEPAGYIRETATANVEEGTGNGRSACPE